MKHVKIQSLVGWTITGLGGIAFFFALLLVMRTGSQAAIETPVPVDEQPAADGSNDLDRDGLTGEQEGIFGTDPLNTDTDGDGLSDWQEVNMSGTNPLDPDSDGDGVPDGEESDAESLPTSTRSPRPDPNAPLPTRALMDYFNLASAGQVEESWALLTDNFKQIFYCCAPDYHYDAYVEWWDSVESVEFGETYTIIQVGNRALVFAELSYHKANGLAPDTMPYFELLYEDGQWRLSNQSATQVF